jgi:uncharacterized protein YodC (DUF2158 family)
MKTNDSRSVMNKRMSRFFGSFNRVIFTDFIVADTYLLLILYRYIYRTMEKKFVFGDIVLMIADGPRMVVESYVVDEDPPGQFTESNEFVNVVYFAGDSFKRDTFHQDLLIFAEEV